ncbi:zf-HC2 domain-containing protein [Kitasatospora sp. NPDC056531]|uniref:zf-HC2 domain-containing protein n=1 Tax=Kitasatospora sp. NPDC056531 TaxID=3345856 RepID=UPI0036CF5E7D
MTCADYRTAASARLDGELTGRPGDVPDLDSHPARCADCADWLAAARRLRYIALAARGPSREWSDSLAARLVKAVSGDS